ERIAEAANRIGQRRNRLLDLVGVVPVAALRRDPLAKVVDIEIAQPGNEIDVAELVAVPLLDRERDVETVAVGSQLRNRGHDAEVRVAARQIELTKQLPIEREAVRVVGVVGAQYAPPATFAGLHDLAQPPVAELLIADEVDPLHAGNLPFVDLEHEID